LATPAFNKTLGGGVGTFGLRAGCWAFGVESGVEPGAAETTGFGDTGIEVLLVSDEAPLDELRGDEVPANPPKLLGAKSIAWGPKSTEPQMDPSTEAVLDDL